METGDDWRTSAFSNPNGECVEVASGVRVRDTRDRDGPELRFGPLAWLEFTRRVRRIETLR